DIRNTAVALPAMLLSSLRPLTTSNLNLTVFESSGSFAEPTSFGAWAEPAPGFSKSNWPDVKLAVPRGAIEKNGRTGAPDVLVRLSSWLEVLPWTLMGRCKSSGCTLSGNESE